MFLTYALCQDDTSQVWVGRVGDYVLDPRLVQDESAESWMSHLTWLGWREAQAREVLENRDPTGQDRTGQADE